MDKFGHHIHRRLRFPEFLDNFDAVNKEYVDKQSELYITKQEFQKIIDTLKTDIESIIKTYYTKAELERILELKNE